MHSKCNLNHSQQFSEKLVYNTVFLYINMSIIYVCEYTIKWYSQERNVLEVINESSDTRS